MDTMRVLAHLKREIVDIKAGYEATLLAGALADFAEYKYIAGTIRGLVLVEQELTDLVQKLENVDE